MRLDYYSVGIAALTFPKDFTAYLFNDIVNFGVSPGGCVVQ